MTKQTHQRTPTVCVIYSCPLDTDAKVLACLQVLRTLGGVLQRDVWKPDRPFHLMLSIAAESEPSSGLDVPSFLGAAKYACGSAYLIRALTGQHAPEGHTLTDRAANWHRLACDAASQQHACPLVFVDWSPSINGMDGFRSAVCEAVGAHLDRECKQFRCKPAGVFAVSRDRFDEAFRNDLAAFREEVRKRDDDRRV